MKDFSEQAKAIHQNAVEHGFWNENTTVALQIALIHDELSEALEAYRDGDKVYELSGKPEGIAVELADAAIRIADLLAYFDIDLIIDDPEEKTEGALPDMLCNVHLIVSDAWGGWGEWNNTSRFARCLKEAFNYLWEMINGLTDGEAEEIIMAKVEYNKSRPFRHGHEHF